MIEDWETDITLNPAGLVDYMEEMRIYNIAYLGEVSRSSTGSNTDSTSNLLLQLGGIIPLNIGGREVGVCAYTEFEGTEREFLTGGGASDALWGFGLRGGTRLTSKLSCGLGLDISSNSGRFHNLPSSQETEWNSSEVGLILGGSYQFDAAKDIALILNYGNYFNSNTSNYGYVQIDLGASLRLRYHPRNLYGFSILIGSIDWNSERSADSEEVEEDYTELIFRLGTNFKIEERTLLVLTGEILSSRREYSFSQDNWWVIKGVNIACRLGVESWASKNLALRIGLIPSYYIFTSRRAQGKPEEGYNATLFITTGMGYKAGDFNIDMLLPSLEISELKSDKSVNKSEKSDWLLSVSVEL